MSVVVVKNYKDKIVIGSDNISIRGITQSKKEFSKLQRVSKDIIIGSVGAKAIGALLRQFAKNHRPLVNNCDGILDFLNEFIVWKKKKLDDSKDLSNNAFILCFKGKVYMIEGGSFLVDEINTNEYEAIGAGMDYSLSALYLGHTVRKAVEVACELTIYCEKPITIFEMKK